MNKRIFKYLLLISVAMAAKVKGESKNSQQAAIYQRVFGPSSYSERENSRYPNIYFLGTYGPVQIYRSQSQRTASYFKSTFSTISKFNAYFQFLSNTFRQTRVGFARSCKLILFPFHVFW
ncbi:MAG: hypothetical protein V4592_25890 [Bacteroidota bacterium]